MEKYNISGIRGQYRYILIRDLSYDDAKELKDILNTKNEWVKANIQLVEDVRTQSNVPIDEIINNWLTEKGNSEPISTEGMHKIHPMIVGRTFCNYCGRDLTRTDERCIYCSGEPVCPMCKTTMEIIKGNVVKLYCHNCGVFFDGVDWYDNDL